jgi:regulator of RNase E activity RraB
VNAATGHRKTRTVLTLTYKIVDNDILRDENGDPVLIPTYVSEVIEEPNVPAAIVLFNHAMQRASRAETPELKASAAEDAPDPSHITAVERRLAASIRVRREEIDVNALRIWQRVIVENDSALVDCQSV